MTSPILIASIALLAIIAALSMNPRFYAWVRAGLGLRREAKERERTRANTPGTTIDDFHRAHAPTVNIDDRTWGDLDLDQVFATIDHTSSRPGQQYLRHLLRSPAQDAESVATLNRVVDGLEQDPAANAAIKEALRSCDDPRASFLATLVYGVLPDRPKLWWVFPILTVSALALLVAVYFWPRALIGILAIAVVNILAQLYYRPRINALLPAIHELPALLRAAEDIGAIRTNIFPAERETLRLGAAQVSVLRRATAWLKFEPSQQANELAAMLYTYASFLLALDMTAYVFTITAAKRFRLTLQQMFEAIGFIDATQSIASWRRTLPHWSRPEFTGPQKELSVTGLVHPLIRDAVANDVTVRNSSVLITGSNMSGKTTFIRAMGINAILAQSVGTVVATLWRSPVLRVMSSIGRSDSVLEGRSYYLAEVESIRALIAARGEEVQHLFIIDELFRGTNTAERVAGAYAVLDYLNRGADIVFVATHDTELLGMLGGAYAPHHFREEIAGGNLTFDFTLRDGLATTRNAIALLELMKYPTEIVDRARSALS